MHRLKIGNSVPVVGPYFCATMIYVGFIELDDGKFYHRKPQKFDGQKPMGTPVKIFRFTNQSIEGYDWYPMGYVGMFLQVIFQGLHSKPFMVF